jgi:hypothetical protein
MNELQRELEEIEIRKIEILYEMYIILKYDLTNIDNYDK